MNEKIQNKIKFSAVVTDTKPDAVYLDRRYTQFVDIEFSNGQKAWIFDGDMLISEKMIGKKMIVSLSMLVQKLVKIEKNELSLTPVHVPGLEIIGEIEEILIPEEPKAAEQWRLMIINFGIGKIVLDVNIEKYSLLNLKTGDYIHASGRVDLVSIG